MVLTLTITLKQKSNGTHLECTYLESKGLMRTPSIRASKWAPHFICLFRHCIGNFWNQWQSDLSINVYYHWQWDKNFWPYFQELGNISVDVHSASWLVQCPCNDNRKYGSIYCAWMQTVPCHDPLLSWRKSALWYLQIFTWMVHQRMPYLCVRMMRKYGLNHSLLFPLLKYHLTLTQRISWEQVRFMIEAHIFIDWSEWLRNDCNLAENELCWKGYLLLGHIALWSASYVKSVNSSVNSMSDLKSVQLICEKATLLVV